MTVNIPSGSVFQRFIDVIPCLQIEDQTVTLDAASGSPRIDIIEGQIKVIADKDDVVQTATVATGSAVSISNQTIQRDIKYYLDTRKQTGTTTLTPATAGTLTGTVAIPGTIDLSSDYLLNLADTEDGSYQEIDCRGATPGATTRAEIINAINSAVGRTMAATGAGNVIVLTGNGTGQTSYFEIKPPTTDSDKDCLQVVFGLAAGGIYRYTFEGDNEWFKLAEIDVGAATTVITSGLIRNVNQKATWANNDGDDIFLLTNQLAPIVINLNKNRQPFDTDDNYTVTDIDDYGFLSLSSAIANKVFKLPVLANNQERVLTLYNNDSTYELNVNGNGATINGVATIDLPKQDNYITIIGKPGEWKILSEEITCHLRLDTYAGYGSSDTKIMQFTNEREDFGNLFSNNHGGYGTDGLEITIAKNGKYVVSFSSRFDAAQYLGISLNSSQLTTNIQSITDADRLIEGHVSAGGNDDAVSWSGYLDAGDVVRPHTSGGANSGGSGRSIFTISYLGS
jgi:hypothetical protein